MSDLGPNLPRWRCLPSPSLFNGLQFKQTAYTYMKQNVYLLQYRLNTKKQPSKNVRRMFRQALRILD